MDTEFLVSFLQQKNTCLIEKKRHTYLTYHGLKDQYVYVLNEGIIKTSIILKDGREFNISYIAEPDIISLLHDEVSQFTSSPFNVRIESEVATFYRIPRVMFWEFVNQTQELQTYVKNYYRKKLSESLYRQKNMIMNNKKGAVCAFLYSLIEIFGKPSPDGLLLDFSITNEDIAGFCGISTRNSVNRIIHNLKEEKVIKVVKQRILILNPAYLYDFINQ